MIRLSTRLRNFLRGSFSHHNYVSNYPEGETMKRLWILEEIGDQPPIKLNLPLEWYIIINFATEDRSRTFKVLHIIGDENALPQKGDRETCRWLDDWF